MIPCPECQCTSEVLKTSRCSNGTRRRRHECRACGHRWTTHDGEPPGHRGGRRPGTSSSYQRLCPEEVRRILEADGSLRQIARQVGRSLPTVAAVISGQRYTEWHPDLPRRVSLSCSQCKHWQNRCGLGFPDPEEEGLQAATWCNSYSSREEER